MTNVKICPKCNRRGFVTYKKIKKKSGKEYIYKCFGHRVKKNGKWTTEWCYIEKIAIEPKIIEKIKPEIHQKAGTIKYKCECGEVTEYLDLILTNGKCPKCGEVLIEFKK